LPTTPDYNLLNKEKDEFVYQKVRSIVLKFGKIHDEAMKFYGPLVVLDYAVGERKLKIEISNREFDNHYEIKRLKDIGHPHEGNDIAGYVCSLTLLFARSE
jgi:hypothetical protein